MRILFCTHQMRDGGAERVLSLWIKGFVDRGNNVSLVICTRNNQIDYPLPEVVNIFNILPPSKGRIAAFVERVRSLRRIIKKERPDIIITALGPWGLWAFIASLGIKTKIIHTEHNSFERPPETPMPLSVKFYKFYVNKLFDRVTVLTEADKKVIGKRLKNVSVLPNPLSFEPAKSVPPKDNIVVAAGRLDYWHVKGFDILMKAWNLFSPIYPEWRLIVAGSGSSETKDFLCSILSEQALATVGFIGFTPNIEELFKKSSVFVLSSRYEGFGMVLLEAMSQGCACVACDYKGRQKEIIIDESMGYLCDTNSPESICENLCAILNDSEHRKRIQENGIERAKQYSLNAIMNEWDKIITGIK